MKVMFLFQGVPHYYNYVLNKLHQSPGVTVVNVIPRLPSSGIGAGVFQSQKDIQYELRELDEYRPPWGDYFFRSFWRLLWRELPDVIVCTNAQLKGFMHDLPTRMSVRLLRIPVLMKSIPFRLPKYGELRKLLEDDLAEWLRQPSPRLRGVRMALAPLGSRRAGAIVGGLDRAFEVLRRVRGQTRIRTELRRREEWARYPMAHVNYIDAAYEIYGSYGVERERIFVTRNSPDTDRLSAAREQVMRERRSKADPCRLIHVGRLVTWKRVDLLIRAAALLKTKYPTISVVVLGDGPQKEEWRNLARTLGMDDQVEFCGGVYDPIELGRQLMSSAVYVLAGMGGLSINEAMCFGLPVICSVCDGTEKFLVRDGQNGLFFRDGDAANLAEQIDRLLADPAARERMGRESLRIVRDEINVDTVIQAYLRAFEYAVTHR